jgi:hypothetical protein
LNRKYALFASSRTRRPVTVYVPARILQTRHVSPDPVDLGLPLLRPPHPHFFRDRASQPVIVRLVDLRLNLQLLLLKAHQPGAAETFLVGLALPEGIRQAVGDLARDVDSTDDVSEQTEEVHVADPAVPACPLGSGAVVVEILALLEFRRDCAATTGTCQQPGERVPVF